MVSVRFHFSPGFPLGGGFPAELIAPAWWYKTAGGEERLLRRVAQQNEAPPAEFLCSLEEDVPQRVAPAVFGTPQRREFPWEQTVRFCSSGIQNMQSTTCIPISFCAFSCSHGQGCNTAYIPY
jgi:hypothetical protein